MLHFVEDAVPLRNVSYTPDGYMVADAFTARTGIQLYRGSEVNRPDLDIVRVYRPESEVFKADSLNSYAHAPVTMGHPPGGVNATNWRDRAIGEVSTEALRDGQRLRLKLLVKDQQSADEVKQGKAAQLSPGYKCKLDWTPGKTEDGQVYDASQFDIVVNHVAIVPRGRAGDCQIGDEEPEWGAVPLADSKEGRMTTKTIVLGDKPVNVLADDAQIVVDYLSTTKQQLTDAQSAAATKDGEIAALKQKLADAEMTPEKLAKLVADRAVVSNAYKRLTGKDAPVTAQDSELKREAVKAKLGDAAVQMSDEAINGAFTAFSADAKTVDPLRQAVAQGLNVTDSMTQLTNDVLSASGLTLKKEA